MTGWGHRYTCEEYGYHSGPGGSPGRCSDAGSKQCHTSTNGRSKPSQVTQKERRTQQHKTRLCLQDELHGLVSNKERRLLQKFVSDLLFREGEDH